MLAWTRLGKHVRVPGRKRHPPRQEEMRDKASLPPALMPAPEITLVGEGATPSGRAKSTRARVLAEEERAETAGAGALPQSTSDTCPPTFGIAGILAVCASLQNCDGKTVTCTAGPVITATLASFGLPLPHSASSGRSRQPVTPPPVPLARSCRSCRGPVPWVIQPHVQP